MNRDGSRSGAAGALAAPQAPRRRRRRPAAPQAPGGAAGRPAAPQALRPVAPGIRTQRRRRRARARHAPHSPAPTLEPNLQPVTRARAMSARQVLPLAAVAKRQQRDTGPSCEALRGHEPWKGRRDSQGRFLRSPFCARFRSEAAAAELEHVGMWWSVGNCGMPHWSEL